MSVKNLGLWVRLILRIPTFSQYFASKRGVRLIPRCGLHVYPGKYGKFRTPELFTESLLENDV